MKLLNRFNVSRETKNGPRKFSIEMTMSGVVSLAVVVLLGMCWVFILGILLGRGYRPEKAVPQLEHMLPTTEPSQLPDETPNAEPKVLKPEDLTFMDHDQPKDGEVVADSTQKTDQPDPQKTPDKPPVKSRDLTDAKPATPAPRPATVPAVPPRPVKEAKPEPAKQPSVTAKTAAATPARPAAKPTAEPKSPFEKQKGTRYQATYQVASFPSRDQANTALKRLASKGYKATIHEAKINNQTVYRVHIQVEGSDAEIAAGLKKSGEKGPILLRKKAL